MLTSSGRTRLGERRFLANPTFVPGTVVDRALWLRRGFVLAVAAGVVATMVFLTAR